MAMGLPTIGTNWSGNLEFMKPWNSYLIKVEDLVEISSGAFKGHRWAQPSVAHLRALMRQVYSNPTEARSVGSVAEKFIHSHYSPQVIGQLIHDKILAIHTQLEQNK
jgi:hypothetical protein